MFIFAPKHENLTLARSQSGPLLELEQRMTEFLAQNSGHSDTEVLDSVRLHHHEIRRERMRAYQRREAASTAA